MSKQEETRRLLTDDSDDDDDEKTIPRNNVRNVPRNGTSTPSSRRSSSLVSPRPSLRRQYFAAFLILLVELAERMTYYGLVCNLVLLGTSVLHYSSVDSVTINLVFTSVCYFMPVLGGLVSDICCGYFNTLYGAGLVYIVGAACFPILTFDYEAVGQTLGLDGKRTLFFIGVMLITMGTGGIKSNVGPFGAEQLQNAGPHATQTYFTWFYWFINVGAFVAYALIAYVQQEISFFVGFVIPTSVMTLAVLTLVCSKRLFKIRKPEGSVLPKIFNVIYNANKVKRTSILHVPQTLDYARRRNGGRYHDNDVDDVKALIHLFPIFLCCIVFWVVYNQMSSTFFLQGERMDIRLGAINLPAASLSLFDALAIMILAPIMDRLVYPLLDRVYKRPSQLVRMGLGMVFASLAMIVAGVLEIYRKEDIALNGPIQQVLAQETFNASSLSVLYQVPQFIFIGSGEIFLVMTGQEFAFSESPESMKAAVMGLFLITNGFGALIGSVMINLANAISSPYYWVPNEINEGRMEYYCFMLAGLMLVNFIAYLLVARTYTYNSLKPLQRHNVAEYSKRNGFSSRTTSGSSDDEIRIVHRP